MSVTSLQKAGLRDQRRAADDRRYRARSPSLVPPARDRAIRSSAGRKLVFAFVLSATRGCAVGQGERVDSTVPGDLGSLLVGRSGDARCPPLLIEILFGEFVA
jgi:hypothetical protein